MNLYNMNFHAQPDTSFCIPKHTTIIIGFSGGPDSVYLLLFLKNLQQSHNLKLIAAHLDHEWRPQSAQEAAWCKQFCQQHDIEFRSEKARNINSDQSWNGSKEQWGRQLRRTFFENIAKDYQNVRIALGHHKDDQVETFFIRLARGATITGLAGMKGQDGLYVRPLLHLAKNEILAYLGQHQISYLQDPSNQDPSFLRNRIRHELIPILKTIDSRFDNHIYNTMKHHEQVDDFLEQITIKELNQICICQNPWSVNTQQFLELHPVLQYRMLLKMLIQAQATFVPSTALFAEIIRFLQSNKHLQHQVHPDYKIKKDKNSFSILKQ